MDYTNGEVFTVLVPDWSHNAVTRAVAAMRRRLRQYVSEFGGHDLMYSADFQRDVIRVPGQLRSMTGLPDKVTELTMNHFRIVKIQQRNPVLHDGKYQAGLITIHVRTNWKTNQQIITATGDRTVSLSELNACFDRFTGKKVMYLRDTDLNDRRKRRAVAA